MILVFSVVSKDESNYGVEELHAVCSDTLSADIARRQLKQDYPKREVRECIVKENQYYRKNILD